MSAAPVALVPRPPSAAGPARREGLATRRPVSTFVALFVVAGVLLGTVGLTGAVVPRLETPGWNAGAPSPGERAWSIEVRNAGLAPIEVEAVTWPVDGLVDPELLVGRYGLPVAGRSDPQPFAPFTLGGGESRVLVLSGSVRCLAGAVVPVSVQGATLHVRSVLGRRHAIDVGSGPFAPGGPGPFASGGVIEHVLCP